MLMTASAPLRWTLLVNALIVTAIAASDPNLPVHAWVQQFGGPNYCIALESDIFGQFSHYDSTAGRIVTHALTSVKAGSMHVSGRCMNHLSVDKFPYNQQLVLEFLPEGLKTGGNKWRIEMNFIPYNRTSMEGFLLGKFQLTAVLPIEGAPFQSHTSKVPTESVDYVPLNRSAMHVLAAENNGVAFSCRSFRLELNNDSYIEFPKLRAIAFVSMPTDHFTAHQEFVHCKESTVSGNAVAIAAIVVGVLVFFATITLLGMYLKRNATKTHHVDPI